MRLIGLQGSPVQQKLLLVEPVVGEKKIIFQQQHGPAASHCGVVFEKLVRKDERDGRHERKTPFAPICLVSAPRSLPLLAAAVAAILHVIPNPLPLLSPGEGTLADGAGFGGEVGFFNAAHNSC